MTKSEIESIEDLLKAIRSKGEFDIVLLGDVLEILLVDVLRRKQGNKRRS